MRRRDVLSLFFLGAVAFYGWSRLMPPTYESGEQTIDDQVLAHFSPWHGPITVAQAAQSTTTNAVPSEGRVLGASTDTLSSTRPTSLLPVEEYYGPALVFTLEEMLQRLNVTINPEDVVEAFPDPALGRGAKIMVYRATPVELTDWGKKQLYRTWQPTVGGFLDEQAIELGDNDRVEPGAKAALTLTDGRSRLVITRVAITEVKTKEKIEFKKIEKEDPDLLRGQAKVTPGVAGERTKTYRVTRENGIEVKRQLLANEVTKQPSDEVRIIGTKVLIGKTYSGRASWYKYNSTKVASDLFKRGTQLRITNLDNGKVIFVTNDGCICSDSGYVVDLHPDHFVGLGGKLTDGVLKRIKVDEILN